MKLRFVYLIGMYTDPTHSLKSHSPKCPNCGGTMTRVRVIPRLGGMPELTVFHCVPCNHVETVENYSSMTTDEARAMVSAA